MVVPPDDVYAPTVGKFLADFAALPPSAFGDPSDVADAVVGLVDMPEPPLRLAVGADAASCWTPPGRPAVEGIRASLLSRLSELDRWAA